MEFAGAFGAGKKKGARSVGLGRVVRSWREKVGKQLSDSRKGYGKSHRDQLSSLPFEIVRHFMFICQAVGERAESHSVIEKNYAYEK